MKWFFRIIFSLFFAIAIGVHIYYVIESDQKPFWWHSLYFIAYGVCWQMIFSGQPFRSRIYALMASFPFFSHLYYGYLHFPARDSTFWVCVLVCVLLPMGFFLIRKKII